MPRKPLSKRLRFYVLHRDNFTCQYCGSSPPDVKLHVDHIVPVSLGGLNDEFNLTTACVDCNFGKHNKNYRRRKRLKARPVIIRPEDPAVVRQVLIDVDAAWYDTFFRQLSNEGIG